MVEVRNSIIVVFLYRHCMALFLTEHLPLSALFLVDCFINDLGVCDCPAIAVHYIRMYHMHYTLYWRLHGTAKESDVASILD